MSIDALISVNLYNYHKYLRLSLASRQPFIPREAVSCTCAEGYGESPQLALTHAVEVYLELVVPHSQ